MQLSPHPDRRPALLPASIRYIDVRGSPTLVVDTLHPVSRITKKRDKRDRMTRPQPLTEIGRGKRVRFANNVKRICFSDSEASQIVEDLRDRPSVITVTEHANIAVRTSSLSRKCRKEKRRQRQNIQSHCM